MADSSHSDARREGVSERAWRRLPANPDPNEDLGYELLDLEAYGAGGDRILFLPKDEDMLKDEAFIIAREEDICSLGE